MQSHWELGLQHMNKSVHNTFYVVPLVYFLENLLASVYSFFVVLTNYHKLGGFKKQTYCLTVLKARSLKSVSLDRNQGVSRVILSRNSRVGSIPCLSQFWWLLTFLTMATILKASVFKSLYSVFTFSVYSQISPSPSL